MSDHSADSYAAILPAVQAFHDKHDFKSKGDEELTYRMALMAEELGELGAAMTTGKPKELRAEEAADLFILLIGPPSSIATTPSGVRYARSCGRSEDGERSHPGIGISRLIYQSGVCPVSSMSLGVCETTQRSQVRITIAAR